MTIQELFKVRVSHHQKQLAKYAKVVFNDHLVLILLIVLGAGGLAYSEYVEGLEGDAIFPRVILSGILVLLLSMGRVGTLLKQADKVFLLPKEQELAPILRRALYRSLFIFSIPIGLLSAASMPLLDATGVLSFSQWPFFFVHLLSLKAIDLIIQFDYFTIHQQGKGKQRNLISFFIILSGVVLSLFGGAFYDLLFSLSVALGLGFTMLYVWSEKHRFKWDEMIEAEEKRMHLIYQVINLFTDVPQISSHTKRLKFLDRLIHWQSKRVKNIYYYYFVRVFYRNTTYSGLVFRLVCVGSVLLLLTNQLWMAVLLSIVFLYLIGFQLIPLKKTVESQLLFQLYPTPPTGKIKAIQRFIFEVLVVISVIFSIIGFTHTWQTGVSLLFANGAFSTLFSTFYLPRKLKK